MRLRIEDWSEQNLNEDAKVMMDEAVLCYKVGAYRSSFLMSYIAFKQTLRHRLSTFNSKPDKVSVDDWNKVQSDLSHDDKWDSRIDKIMDAPYNDTPKNGDNTLGHIFKFSNRDKVKYRYLSWKYTRHSCAHGKSEIIISSTVEQFWNYLQNDLSEFYVLGGKEYLRNELLRTYKYMNSLGVSHLTQVLKDISIVYGNQVIDCFESLHQDGKILNYPVKEDKEFWDTIVDFDDANIRNAFIRYIIMYNNTFMDWYLEYPKVFYLIDSMDSTFIQKHVVPYIYGERYSDKKEYWELLYAILVHDERLINLSELTSKYRIFENIDKIELNKRKLDKLIGLEIFNDFIYRAGKDLFRNDSNSHWEYYEYGNIKRDKYIVECFKYANWNSELIKRLSSALYGLYDSMEARTRYESISNGEKRKEIFIHIVKSNRDEIRSVINANDKLLHADSKLFELLE